MMNSAKYMLIIHMTVQQTSNC